MSALVTTYILKRRPFDHRPAYARKGGFDERSRGLPATAGPLVGALGQGGVQEPIALPPIMEPRIRFSHGNIGEKHAELRSGLAVDHGHGL